MVANDKKNLEFFNATRADIGCDDVDRKVSFSRYLKASPEWKDTKIQYCMCCVKYVLELSNVSKSAHTATGKATKSTHGDE